MKDTLQQTIIRIDKLQHQVYSLKTIQSGYENEVLHKQLEQASSTIANLESISTGYSTAYAIIALLITLFTVVAPLLVYFFSVKPAQEILENINANMDTKISRYLKIKDNLDIENAISELESESLLNFENGINFFKLRSHYDLTEEFKLRIISILDNETLFIDYRVKLLNVLAMSNPSKSLDKFFIKEDDPTGSTAYILTYAFKYFLRPINRAKRLSSFKLILHRPFNHGRIQATLANVTVYGEKQEVISLLNDQKLAGIIKDYYKNDVETYNHFMHYVYDGISSKVTIEEAKATVLFKDHDIPSENFVWIGNGTEFDAKI